MSEWLAAFEADVAADMTVTNGTKETKARSENPIVPIVPFVPRVSENRSPVAPPEWLDAVTQLETRPRPESIPSDIWARAVADAGYLVRKWGAALSSCGWTLADLFSAHPAKPLARYDCMGLALLLEGRRIGPIDSDRIAIRQAGGKVLHFLRRRPSEPEVVMLWELPGR